MILQKLLKPNKTQTSDPPTPSPEDNSQALRIVHPGGHVDIHYMAVPAKQILDSNPTFVLTGPDVFRRPWEAMVSPNDILMPGNKFFLVPCRSMRKLRRRIHRQLPELVETVGVSAGDVKPETQSQRVRFGGIDHMSHEVEDSKQGLDGIKKTVTWRPSLNSIIEILDC